MMSDKRDNQRVNAGEREVVADERWAAGMVFVGRELGCMEAKTAGRNRAFPFMCKPTGKTDILSPKMFSPRLFPSADLHHGSFFHRANEPTSRTRRGHPFVPGLERGQPGGVGPAHAARLRRDAPARARLPACTKRTCGSVGADGVPWQGRAHFYGIAARTMRQILVQHARSRQAAKRGGQQEHVALDTVALPAVQKEVDFVELDDLLRLFADTYPRKAEVVELKFFGGLEAREIAEVLQTNEKTVLRDKLAPPRE